MAINAAGLFLIKEFEGLRLTAYKCPAGRWTIGFGTTSGVTPGMKITPTQAESFLQKDLLKFEDGVRRSVRVKLSDNQFAALVSFAYNLGTDALQNSTLLRLLNAGKYGEAADQLLRWNLCNGQPLAGLTRRRVAERRLFLS